jgi:hypothetical protein
MATYTFSGSVHPNRAAIRHLAFAPLEVESPDYPGKLIVRVTIIWSQVSVVVDTADDINDDVFTLKNILLGLVASAVDALGYMQGHAYDIEITSVVFPDGSFRVFGVDVPVLTESRNARPLAAERVVELTLQNRHVRRALTDLRNAVQASQDTAFYCYRAVESIRQSWADSGSEGKQWVAMNTALRIDRSAHDAIKRWADDQRHGAGILPMTDSDRASALLHAWGVTDRYLVLIDQNVDMLPESFPLLAS